MVHKLDMNSQYTKRWMACSPISANITWRGMVNKTNSDQDTRKGTFLNHNSAKCTRRMVRKFTTTNGLRKGAECLIDMITCTTQWQDNKVKEILRGPDCSSIVTTGGIRRGLDYTTEVSGDSKSGMVSRTKEGESKAMRIIIGWEMTQSEESRILHTKNKGNMMHWIGNSIKEGIDITATSNDYLFDWTRLPWNIDYLLTSYSY